MPTLSLAVAASGDDGRWSDGSVSGQNSYFSGSENSIALGHAATGFDFVSGWFRFTGAQFSGTPTITSAVLTLTGSNGVDLGTCTFTVCAVKQDNPTAPSSSTDISGRPRSTATVSWAAGPGGTGTSSPGDLSAVIQEIVNAYNYVASAKALMLLLVPQPTPTGTRSYQAFDAGSGQATLVITYTVPASGATAVTLTDPTPVVGAVGAPSGNYTVGANGAITGTVRVTPADGGAGGTFTPAFVDISSASPTGTFTYTPASAGAKTITVTNNGSLTNPSSHTFTAYVVATTYTFTGPSAGSNNAPSAPFTVALPANTILSSSVVVTVSDGGGVGAGSWTPASFTIPANTPAASATGTYTPASNGTKTLTPTNSGGLTNPAALSYVVTTPPDTTNLLLVRAVDITGNDGDAIGTWLDTSTFGHDFSQATAGSKPILRKGANGINNVPALEFNGSKSMQTVSWLSSVFDRSFFVGVVLQRTAGQTAEQTVLSFGADQLRITVQGSLGAVRQNLPVAGPGPFVKVYMPSGTSIYNSGFYATASSRVASPTADRMVIGVSYDGAHLRIGVNGNWSTIQHPLGTSAAASGNDAGPLGLTGAVTVGSKADGSNGFVGLISRIALYSAAQSYYGLKSKLLTQRQAYAVVPQDLAFGVGDSTMAGQNLANGTQDIISQMLVVTPALTGNYDLINAGVGGSTSSDWLNIYAPEQVLFGLASDRRRQVAIVMGFGNDSLSGIPSYSAIDEGRKLYQNHREMCSMFKQHGMQVIVCTILPRQGAWGTAQAGGASSITLASGASSVNNIYNGLKIGIYAGTGAGQEKTITGYVGSTKVATVNSAWTTVPDNTSQYVIGPLDSNDRYLTANRLIRESWAEYGDALADVAAVSGLDDPANPTYYQDGVHPTAAGATLIAQTINPILNGLAAPAAPASAAARLSRMIPRVVR